MRKLQVPANISLRWELWRGFGKPELIKTIPICLVALVGAVIYCRLSANDAAVFFACLGVVLTIAFCVGFFSKIEGNQSIFDFIKRQMEYQRTQQVFFYQKKNGKEGVHLVQPQEES